MRVPAATALMRVLAATALMLIGGPNIAFAQTPQSSPARQTCAESMVTILGGSADDQADACAGATSAIRFFAGLGHPPRDPVVIEITPNLPGEAGKSAAGCFIELRRRIFMLPYRAFQAHKTWFGVGIRRSTYRSLAAHETAHALASCHFAIANPTIQAKEYLAYVVMFSVMEPDFRAIVLRANPGAGFDHEDRATAMLVQFDPMRFGIQAYRHYLKPDVGPAFLASILAGKALTD